jgi:hypothetical protein
LGALGLYSELALADGFGTCSILLPRPFKPDILPFVVIAKATPQVLYSF